MQNSSRESYLFGAVGMLAGILIGVFIAAMAVNNEMNGMMRMMGMGSKAEMMDDHHGDGMSMAEMVDSLEGKSGDAFDKAFLSEMILHHQGAIEMAHHAQQDAKHDEIGQLADEIVKAQTKEIDQMRSWQKAWGY